ncbi:MAG: AraC family transcriptional regulator [Ruminococcaceae bacterium]|nr:AraC family transcriptional regulator [Oscillospiraceae bacterium]
MANSDTNIRLSNYFLQDYDTIPPYKYYQSTGLDMPYFHWHPHYEILLITKGNYILRGGGRTITGTKPAAIVHCPYHLHNANAVPDQVYERYVINFTRKVIGNFSPEVMDITPLLPASFIYTEPDSAEMDKLIENAKELRDHKDDPAMFSLFIALILRRIMKILEDGRGEIFRSGHSYIQDVLQYIPEHLPKPATAAELAAKYSVCTAKFHRDFKKLVGKTYKEHLTDIRLTLARQLLESGTSIIAASIDTGYSSQSHFVKAFRDYFGITPGEFRRTIKRTAISRPFDHPMLCYAMGFAVMAIHAG